MPTECARLVQGAIERAERKAAAQPRAVDAAAEERAEAAMAALLAEEEAEAAGKPKAKMAGNARVKAVPSGGE